MLKETKSEEAIRFVVNIFITGGLSITGTPLAMPMRGVLSYQRIYSSQLVKNKLKCTCTFTIFTVKTGP